MSVFTQNLREGLGIVKYYAFFHSPGSLFVRRSHRVIGFKTGHIDCLRAKTECCSGAFNRDVAAAEDHDLFSDRGSSLFKSSQEVCVDLNAFEVIARKRKSCALMGTDGYKYSVKSLFQQCRDMLDLRSGLHRDIARFEDIRDFLIQNLTRQTIGRNAVTKLSAEFFGSFEDCYGMAEFRAEIGRGKAGRAAAHDGDLLAGSRFVECLCLPCAVIMFRRESLQVADGNRFVQILMLALCLAVVYADIAEAVRERNLLTDGCVRRSIIALIDKADIARYINMRRTSYAAGHHIIFFANFGRSQLVADRSGRTYFRAGLAETAVRVGKELVVKRSGIYFQILSLVILQYMNSAEIIAGTYAASAEDAAVHIMKKKRIFFIYGKSLCTIFQASGLRSDILDQHLKFAVAVLRTCGAVFGMTCQKQFQCQHSEALYFLCLCLDDKSVFCLKLAGRYRLLLTFDLNDAHAAGA